MSEAVSFTSLDGMSQAELPLQSLLNARGSSKEKNQMVAKEFESIFLSQILQQFDKTVDREDDILSGGREEEMYRGLMHQELARAMAFSGGIGLSEMIAAELDKQSPEEIA